MNPHAPRILIIRNDRLGDLVLALPVARAIRRDAPKAYIGLLASAYAAPLVEKDPDFDAVYSVAQGDFRERIKAAGFDAALVLFANWRNAWLALRCGIPKRVGPSFRPFSLLFTHRVGARRSEGLRSEADYNQDFLAPLAVPSTESAPSLKLGREDIAQARAWLKKKKLLGRGKPLVMLHPGSGGSAWNWSPQRYGQLGRELAKKNKARILVTGSSQERALVELVRSGAGHRALTMDREFPIRVFAGLLSHADLFVSGSTGPMHLAAALGAPTLSFFPPLRSMSPLRWGPLGNVHSVLTPPGLGISDRINFGPDSVLRACMDRITVEDALRAAETILQIRRHRGAIG
jgi:ADP-heptose:LPS heptosyltransferase